MFFFFDLAALSSTPIAHCVNVICDATAASLMIAQSSSDTRPNCLGGCELYAPRSVGGLPRFALVIAKPIRQQ
jgi:hypothetical protein